MLRQFFTKRYLLACGLLMISSLVFGVFVRFDILTLFSSIFVGFSIVLPFFSIVFLLLAVRLKNELSRTHKGILLLGAIFFIVLSVYLLFLEKNNFPNYVYSTYGLKPTDLLLLLFLSLLLVAIYSFKIGYLHTVSVFHVSQLNIFAIPFLILLLTAVYASRNAYGMVLAPQPTYEDLFDKEYKYLNAMVNAIPSDCPIIHPPKSSKWPSLSNQPFIRYFLYPKMLISGDLAHQPMLSSMGSTYCFAAVNSDDPSSWPAINLTDRLINFSSDEFSFDQSWIQYTTLESLPNETNENVHVYKITFNE